jgi:hypothetical protein
MRAEARKLHDEYPVLQQSDTETFYSVFDDAITALDRARVPYLVGGGIAAKTFGRVRVTHDIDFFVPPTDAIGALEALAKAGFKTEKTNPRWLFKGFKEDVMVDIIFASTGEIRVDDAMMEHSRIADFAGRRVRILPPEDLIMMKIMIVDEDMPRHWHDALGVIRYIDIDWDYLMHRARYGTRRLLSALLFAQSLDLQVPDVVIKRLFHTVYEASI